MKIKSAALETVCGIKSALPDSVLPEIAFAGKSNVGKSSLINAIVERKALARTSGTPGKTQTLNFYNVNGQMYLVDLPGYGYAKVSQKEREGWGRMIDCYLSSRRQLKGVILLVDIRHEPSANDKAMFDWIRGSGYDPVVVATKLDKIKRSQVDKNVSMIKRSLETGADTPVMTFSAQTKQGRDGIRDLIYSMAMEK